MKNNEIVEKLHSPLAPEEKVNVLLGAGFTKKLLAEAVGADPHTVWNWQKFEKVGRQYLDELEDVRYAVEKLVGSMEPERAVFWLHERNSHLVEGDRAPLKPVQVLRDDPMKVYDLIDLEFPVTTSYLSPPSS